tara:strand:+ start:332 stop:1171 length:840 start_codon:yes stop_codon:yes gene_type:complete
MIDQKLKSGLQDNIEEEELKVEVEDSDSDEIEVIDDEEEDSTSEDIPEEAKKIINPKMKKKTQKRITGLIKDKGELSRTVESLKKEIESLKSKENYRSQKEINSENEVTLNQIRQDMKKATEEGNDEAFVKAQEAMVLHLQKSQSTPSVVDTPEQTEAYFKSKNPWYGVEQAKTYAARQISNEVYSDPNLSHLSNEQKLDEVARITNSLPEFKKNPYQTSVSGEAPSTIGRKNSNTITITRAELESARVIARTIDPNVSEKDIKKMAVKFKKNMNKEAV